MAGHIDLQLLQGPRQNLMLRHRGPEFDKVLWPGTLVWGSARALLQGPRRNLMLRHGGPEFDKLWWPGTPICDCFKDIAEF